MFTSNAVPQRPTRVWLVFCIVVFAGLAIAAVVDPHPAWIAGVLLYAATIAVELIRLRRWRAHQGTQPRGPMPA